VAFLPECQSKEEQPAFYLLISLLHHETTIVNWQMQMLSKGKVLRRRHIRKQNADARLHALWKQFDAGELSAHKLLSCCSYLYSPDV